MMSLPCALDVPDEERPKTKGTHALIHAYARTYTHGLSDNDIKWQQ